MLLSVYEIQHDTACDGVTSQLCFVLGKYPVSIPRKSITFTSSFHKPRKANPNNHKRIRQKWFLTSNNSEVQDAFCSRCSNGPKAYQFLQNHKGQATGSKSEPLIAPHFPTSHFCKIYLLFCHPYGVLNLSIQNCLCISYVYNMSNMPNPFYSSSFITTTTTTIIIIIIMDR